MILIREIFFSPEFASKVVNFAKKNDRINVLIVLARDEEFFLENDPKGRPLDGFLFTFSWWMGPYNYEFFNCS